MDEDVDIDDAEEEAEGDTGDEEVVKVRGLCKQHAQDGKGR